MTLVLLDEREIPANQRIPGVHPRTVNLPQERELCAFYVTNERDEPLYRHGTVLRKNDGRTHMMPLYHPSTDSAHYVLNMSHGEIGFHPRIKKVRNVVVQSDDFTAPQADFDPENVGPKGIVSIRQFYRYRLRICGDPKGSAHFLYPYGTIAQQYIIDQSIKVDQQQFEYIRKNAELYCCSSAELRAALQQLVRHRGQRIGRVLKLSKHVVWSMAYYQTAFYECMAMFQRVGRPTFMITSTCNPTWPELKENMGADQVYTNRPDVLCRVFLEKKRAMRRLIEEKGVFGKVLAFVESLEF